MSRTIAIGDIHGCAAALASLLKAINPQPQDTIIPLGDYVDRGGDTKGVLDQMLDLAQQCQLVPILGNHDERMLDARHGGDALEDWLDSGGDTALRSYGEDRRIEDVPSVHFQFLENCRTYHQTDTHIFLHANYEPDLPIEKQEAHTLRWLSMRDYVPPKPHCSGKQVIVGHTPQPEILDLGYLVGIDTGVHKGGWLTALDVESGTVWQVDKNGKPRNRKKK